MQAAGLESTGEKAHAHYQKRKYLHLMGLLLISMYNDTMTNTKHRVDCL